MFNLFVVWLLTGVWHGASWNFVVWGLLYFALIAFEKLTGYPDAFRHGTWKWLYQGFALLCVLGGWVLFRAADLPSAWHYLLTMLHRGGNLWAGGQAVAALRENWFFLLAAVLCSTPLAPRLKARLLNQGNALVRGGLSVITVVFYMVVLLWSVSFIVLGSYNPFVYFNF